MIVSLYAALRLALFVLWTLAMMPVYLLAQALRLDFRRVGMFYWTAVLRFSLLGTVMVRGQIAPQRPLLMVGNHLSYMDIVVLGALVPGCFVSKAEVRSWPFFGLLARMARTVFIDRRPSSAGKHRDELVAHLKNGEPLLLFPEGTSGNGNGVLPFKSALFTVAELDVEGRAVAVQPFTLSYTRSGGMPVGYADRPFYAWYADMELLPHLWDLLTRGPFQAEVSFLPPLYLADYGNRKELARACEQAVRQRYVETICGRCPEDARSVIPAAPESAEAGA